MAPHIADSDIAIIGISCRVAGANSPSELWDILASSKDVRSKITRFNIDGFYHPEGATRKGLTNVKHAYMLDDECIDKFDNAFFYTTPQEAVAMDPQQRILLEIAYEAVESAGIPLDDFVGTDTAVFAGMEGCDYHTILARDIDATPRYLATGTPICMAANRLSYFFNLSGPSLAVDTACSSTMAALHQAVRTLQHGDSGMALVCGAKLILNPDMFMSSSELGFLSPSGRCQSFDAAADGYGRGEGVLALLLKPLKAAVADRDPIRAVIKGTRLNQDGRTQGITLPSADAQKENMGELYSELGITSKDIQYLEAHGTGTGAGDPLEFSAIQGIYGPERQHSTPLVVGSVKSNIGHLEACSALASIVKVTECLERGQIPPQMQFTKPNPKIDFKNIEIPTEMVQWPSIDEKVRRAAINTFGAGGTNGHAVLESYPKTASEPTTSPARPYLFRVSAAEDASLRALSLEYAKYIEERRPCLQDLAYTLLSRRSTLRKSMYFTATSIEEVVNSLKSESHKVHTKSSGGVRQTLFLFTGQGAQWAQMGKALIDGFPLFRSVLQDCDRFLAELPDKPSWSIIEELAKPKDQTQIYEAEFSQPLCTALQLGLVALLRAWGLKPDAVVGHSSGEIAAAHAAGLMSLRDAIVTAYYRGLVVSSTAKLSSGSHPRGSMCAVGLGKEDSKALFQEYSHRLQLAAINSPTSCTISGDADAIQKIEAICAKKGHFCRQLRTDTAYHSHHMLPLAPQYERTLQQSGVKSQGPSVACDMFSSVTGLKLEPEECTPTYWKDNMTSMVLFYEALAQCMYAHPGVTTIVEIGPHPALKAPVAEILRTIGRNDVDYFHSCSRERNDFVSLLESTGALIAHGVQLDLAKVNAEVETTEAESLSYEHGNVLTDLPRYQWNHSTGFWAESRLSRNVRFRQFPRHQLLGSRGVEDTPSHPSWRNHLLLKEIPWLAEMKSDGYTEMPPAVFILMALEAARQLQILSKTASSSLMLTDVVFYRPLPLESIPDSESTLEVKLIVKGEESKGRFQFEIVSVESASAETWIRHCSGVFGWDDTPRVDGTSAAWDTIHDGTLLERWTALGNTVPNILRYLRTGTEACTGQFQQSLYFHENYPVDPRVLVNILSVTPLTLVGRNLPAASRFTSVASVAVPIHAEATDIGHFAIDVHPEHPFGARCDIVIRPGREVMSFNGLRYQATGPLTQEPALNSLFFKALSKPDISHFTVPTERTGFSRVVELLTHKWPMSDIRIQGLDNDRIQIILNAFHVHRKEKRPTFRSITIKGTTSEPAVDRVRHVEAFEASQKCHILFTDNTDDFQGVHDQLLPKGLVCFSKTNDKFDKSLRFTHLFERITIIQTSDQPQWWLWRKKPTQTAGRRNAVMFGSPPAEILLDRFTRKSERVSMIQESVVQFCQRPQHDRFDAIVIDNAEKSVITTWPGQVFILWMQTLLKSADSILWATQPGPASPFQQVAGTMLRTLQSEQPSLKVLWLVVPNTDRVMGGGTLERRILEAYASMLEGENEIKLETHQKGPAIVRYYPDDELSTATGLIPPQKVESPLTGKNYALSFAAPGEPVILSSRPQTHALSDEEIEIKVQASVIDPGDIHAFTCGGQRTSDIFTPCKFFAGCMLFGDQGSSPRGTIVGYTTGTHQSVLRVPEIQVYDRPHDSPSTEAACEFAAVAVASCIVDGVTRAREGDIFDLRVDGVLKVALQQMVTKTGATVISAGASSKADFTVTYNVAEGVLVNGQPFDLHTYLQSIHGRKTVAQAWRFRHLLSCPLKTFELPNYAEAFDTPSSHAQPYSTAIHHGSDEQTVSHVPIYKKRTSLFTNTGHYILIGGLGGLGRFICTWMVENGARSIVAISRSGLSSPEAHEMQASINSSGATLQVFKADACDRETMCSILAGLREKAPIQGVINLAMILGDAPMASMTGEEWDRALRVKIDSSWILHEETIEDPLDFFILFSSIASVCGNRNQGNYNVANTFLNALAEYRQSMDLPGISIALGAMTDMGILYDLSKANMREILTRSGLTHLTKTHLAKIMETAIFESSRRNRSLIITGLEMFERDAGGKLMGRTEPLFWTELPEFSHLQTYAPPIAEGSNQNAERQLPLKEQVKRLRDASPALAVNESERDAKLKTLITDAFLAFLSGLVGFGKEAFDPAQALAMYGIDSLSGVSCQYWFYRELGVDVPVWKILGGASIETIVEGVCEGLRHGK